MSERNRFLELDPHSRAIWLDPAEIEFCTYGYEKASLNRILSAANQSKGRSYHYFKDKAALFFAVFERRAATIGDLSNLTVLDATNEGQFWNAAVELAKKITTTLQVDTQFAELMRVIYCERSAKCAVEPLWDALTGCIYKMIEKGQSLGAIRQDLPLALLCEVTLSTLGTIDRWFAEHGQNFAPEKEAEISDLAFGLIITPLLPVKK